MAERVEFQPVSSRLQRAMLKGAGVELDRVVGCSLEVNGPCEIVLCVRVHLGDKEAAAVMAAIAAVDLTKDEWL